MAKTAVLHIGTRKTGTTSIQEAMARACHQSPPVCYPLIGGDRNHNRLTTLYLTHNEWSRGWQHAYPAVNKRFRDAQRRYRRLLFEDLASADCAIISAEDLSTFFTPRAVRCLRRDLESVGFRKFRVVMYVRDPAGYYLSMMQQIVKSTYGNAPQGYHPESFKYELRRMSQTWEQIFPGDLILRRYPGAESGDVVDDFARIAERFLGHTLNVAGAPARMNTTLSAEGMQIMQDYRLAFWPENNGLLTPDAVRLATFLELSGDVVPQTKPALKAAIAERIRQNHSAEVDFIRLRYGVDLRPSEEHSREALDTGRVYRIGELLESVNLSSVEMLLLHFINRELQHPPVRRSLVRRASFKVRRLLRAPISAI